MTEENKRPTPAELRAIARASCDQQLVEFIDSMWNLLTRAAENGKTDVSVDSLIDHKDHEKLEGYHEAVWEYFEGKGFTVTGKDSQHFAELCISFSEGED